MDFEKIGKYQILKELGKGATSTVYLGMDPFANRKVVSLTALVAADCLAAGRLKALRRALR